MHDCGATGVLARPSKAWEPSLRFLGSMGHLTQLELRFSLFRTHVVGAVAMLLRSKKLSLLIFVVTLWVSLSVAQAPAPANRPTSTPYTGDLSIFDNAGRAACK